MSINEIEKHEAEEAATSTKPVAENTEAEAVTDKFDGMSNRDALEKAIQERRDAREEPKEKRAVATPTPTNKEVKDAVAADVEPPSEFSAAGKKAWAEKDIAGIQKEFRRIHDSRTAEIVRAQNAERTAKQEAKTWRDLGEMAAPYIEARGAEGVTPQQAMMEALALIQEFKKADPSTVKAELKKIGIDLDAAPGAAAKKETPQVDPVLLERLSGVEKFIGEQQQRELTQVFAQSINALASLKTRTGEPVYPGFHDTSESGIEFAKELGSLTREPLFISLVRRRFPEATHMDFVREAYIQLGGKVSGDPVRVSAENPKQIEKSRRAAASTPGRAVVRNDASNLVGKLSNRAALARALEESREH